MAITKTEFKKAFREIVSLEFSHIPTDENSIEYTFSEKFIKKMNKLIKAQKKYYWCLINTASKRVAIILLSIFTIFSTAFSVKAIREPILNFIKQVYESFTHYSFEGDTTRTITKEYIITYIPDGFEQTNKFKNDYSINTTYENPSGDVIEFSQKITEKHSGAFKNNENTTINKITVNSISIELHEWHDIKNAIWIYDGYHFELNCYGNVDINTIKEIIQSVK